MDPDTRPSRGAENPELGFSDISGITDALEGAANATRLRILETLRDQDRNFTEIAQALEMHVATDSGLLGYHLRKLTASGLVKRSGNNYLLTRLGRGLLSAVGDLREMKKEEETMGIEIEEVGLSHMDSIMEFFKAEYGVDEEWLQSVKNTYSLLVSGRRLGSEDGEILSLVAVIDDRVVGFLGGRILAKESSYLSLSPEWEDDKELYSWFKSKVPDIETVKKMSNDERKELVKQALSRTSNIPENQLESGLADIDRWQNMVFPSGRPETKDAWIDMIWSTQLHDRFVKKKLLKEFTERAREKGAWSIQTYLRNPEDVSLVTELGYLKADGQFCATYIGPREDRGKHRLMYGIRVGSSPLRWGFTPDRGYQSVKLTDIIGDREGGIALSLDTGQLYGKDE